MDRIQTIKQTMAQTKTDALLVTDPSSIFYLTGQWIHPGERLLVLLLRQDQGDQLLINELFPLPADLGVPKVWFQDTEDSVKLLSTYLQEGETVAVDGNWPSEFLLRLMSLKNCRYLSGSAIINRSRSRKDQREQAAMRSASLVNDQAMARLRGRFYTGITELEAADLLKGIYHDLGADGFSFPPIIAFGKNAADPHHMPDHTQLQVGDSIICDIGCTLNSYAADMTRTFFWQTCPDEAKVVYATVREANQRAEALIKPGVKFSDLDKAARDHITRVGYGEFFTHRLGHSIGIDVHEPGDVSAVNDSLLEEGMVFSIEPGIYLTDRFGVRIEDLVLVTETGCEVLNSYPKDLLILEGE